MSGKILIVDDDLKIQSIVTEILRNHGYQILCAGSGQRANELIKAEHLDLIFLDVKLPDADGIDILKNIMQWQPHIPVVMISGFATIERAVAAIKIGAYDFLEKPFDPQRLFVTTKNALDKSRLEQEQNAFVDQMMSRFGIVGVSPDLRKICSLVNRIAKVEMPVLITGENGVGKELIARAIHELSGRKAFVPVNSAAIPRDLIESELFGHKKGSFTGAIADGIGKFQMADGGTLFLDEVGEMSLDMQSKLLRAIETKEVSAVGSSQVQKLDVRVIAATNQELQSKIGTAQFREDLFFRLRGVSIHILPLRERRDDIPVLAEFFLNRWNEAKQTKKHFSEQALQALKQQAWHGNARELKYFVESLALFVDDDAIDHLQVLGVLRTNEPRNTGKEAGGAQVAAGTTPGPPDFQRLRQFERELIEKTLAETSGNITKAADILKIDRTTLSKKIKRLGLKA